MLAPNPTAPAVMSIDVEDWFQVENLKSVIPRESWEGRQLRVERNTQHLLELMDEHDVKATFFVLGWVAERCPQLVRAIGDAGHEVASHGYGHELIYALSRDQFRDDVRRSVELLEDIAGQPVRGYRAPNFSITDWAVDLLQEVGLTYDSSSFPTVAHDRYGRLAGMSAGEPVVEIRPGFTEVCVSCLRLGTRGLPWGGGGYFRLIPYPVFRRGVEWILGHGGPYVFYMHPWEIDAGQPRVEGLKASYRFRHYNSLDRCEGRFQCLLHDFRWMRMRDLLELRGSWATTQGPGTRDQAPGEKRPEAVP